MVHSICIYVILFMFIFFFLFMLLLVDLPKPPHLIGQNWIHIVLNGQILNSLEYC